MLSNRNGARDAHVRACAVSASRSRVKSRPAHVTPASSSGLVLGLPLKTSEDREDTSLRFAALVRASTSRLWFCIVACAHGRGLCSAAVSCPLQCRLHGSADSTVL